MDKQCNVNSHNLFEGFLLSLIGLLKLSCPCNHKRTANPGSQNVFLCYRWHKKWHVGDDNKYKKKIFVTLTSTTEKCITTQRNMISKIIALCDDFFLHGHHKSNIQACNLRFRQEVRESKTAFPLSTDCTALFHRGRGMVHLIPEVYLWWQSYFISFFHYRKQQRMR